MEQSMPKKRVNESMKNKIMTALFKVLAKGDERKALNTALGKDPKISKNIKAIAKIQKDLEKQIFAIPGGKEEYERLLKL